MNFLANHGALHRTYDPSEAETLAEFYKGAFLYQLTPAGIAAHRGVREVLATRVVIAGRLSASLLPLVHEALVAIAGDAAEGDDSRLAADFKNLFALVSDLADSSATYLRELDAEVNTLAADSDRLAAYKAAVLTYLEKFNRQLGVWTRRIVAAIDHVIPQAVGLIARAARVDAAPRPDGTHQPKPKPALRAESPGRRPGRNNVGARTIARMVAFNMARQARRHHELPAVRTARRMSRGDGIFIYSPATTYPGGERLRAVTVLGENHGGRAGAQ